MLVAIAGHVDHGKTTLVKRLSGVDGDTLPEEKRRGLTIVPGYVYLPMPDGGVIGFVDLPGHVRFMKNLLRGIGEIRFAILVVAADEGLMPQTYEHLFVLRTMGVRKGMVVVTKADQVSLECRLKVARDAQAAVEEYIGTWVVYSVSSTTGRGIDQVHRRLTHEYGRPRQATVKGPFTMAIDRVFHVLGRGTAVTGAIKEGSVEIGDKVELAQTMRSAVVRSIRVHTTDRAQARKGERCALVLRCGTGLEDIPDGEWLVGEGVSPCTTELEVCLEEAPVADARLKDGVEYKYYVGNGERTAKLAILDGTAKETGAWRQARVTLKEPVSAVWNDRCIIRSRGGEMTVAGGRVLDPRPKDSGIGLAYRFDKLAALKAPTADAAIKALVADGRFGIARSWLRRVFNASDEWLDERKRIHGWEEVEGDNDVFVFAGGTSRALRARILDDLSTGSTVIHRYQRSAGAATRVLVDFVVRELTHSVIIKRHKGRIRLKTTEDDHKRRYRELAEAALRSSLKGLRPRDLAERTGQRTEDAKTTLDAVVSCGRAYKVSKSLYVPYDHLSAWQETIQELYDKHSTLTLSDFRQATGLGRNAAIEILEYLDRSGYTRREGNRRILVGGGRRPV